MSRFEQLDPKDQLILAAIRQGLPRDTIARALGVSERHVRRRLQAVRDKVESNRGRTPVMGAA